MSRPEPSCCDLCVVADDLSGAADTAVQFLSPDGEMLLVLDREGTAPLLSSCADDRLVLPTAADHRAARVLESRAGEDTDTARPIADRCDDSADDPRAAAPLPAPTGRRRAGAAPTPGDARPRERTAVWRMASSRLHGVAFDTATRGATDVGTVARLRRVACEVEGLGPRSVYIKVDSQLRGRPGFFVETLRRELGRRCVLIAPAHPDQGRVTLGGVHTVHGVRVAEAEAGRDPVAPVCESRLPALIAEQAGVEVAHVLVGEVERGPAWLGERVFALLATGPAAITFDASRREHLDTIAAMAVQRFPEALLAGSAGLARALAEAGGGTETSTGAPPPACRAVLFVCGSTANAVRAQAAALVEGRRCSGVTLTARSLADAKWRAALRRTATAAWKQGDLLLQTAADRVPGEPSVLLAALVDLVMAAVAVHRPDVLFLSGGDTARAVLQRAGVTAIRLQGEALPGMPWGRAVGGTLDGITIVTRSGAFGQEQDLLHLQGLLKVRRDESRSP